MTVTVTPDKHILLPPELVEELGLEPGDELQFILVANSIQVLRPDQVKSMFGSLAGTPGLTSLDPELRDRSDEVM
jgi:hypothetical protein